MRTTTMSRSLLAGASLLFVGLLATASCNHNDYCLDCVESDGQITDGGGGNGDAADADLLDLDGGDACVSSGVEQCDGMDNDCDGEVDEGTLAGVGADCGSDIGECSTGTTICDAGEIVCDGAVTPNFELCNTLDDDCDNAVDENNPEGGLICGTSQGECESGVQLCNAGTLECNMQVLGGPETCNGLDDDCDGLFDEGITTAGNCGPTSDDGLCTFGTNTCIGGSMQCVGAVLPVLEICDGIDQDCDGNPLNGFNLTSDAQNCGSCGNVCTAPNAFMFCSASNCEIAACETDFHDLTAAPGCEFGPCTFQGAEICDGIDNDCDNKIDEGVDAFAPPCDQDGECNGATSTCNSTLGLYVCSFGATVSVDGNGAIIPEVDCDELDNDCDGQIDEAFVNKGAACDDGELGACRDTGTVVCNGADNGVVCNAVDNNPLASAPPETCNNLDDDCNGLIDDADPRDWVDIGGGLEIMKYEASRPDSTAIDQGFVIDAAVCSDAGRMPWTNVTQPEAEAACARIGATLCDESVWQVACETDNLNPLVEAGTSGLLVVEAEDMTNIAGDHTWTSQTSLGGFSGTAAMRLLSDSGGESSSELADAGQLDQTFTFTTTGNKYIWVRTYADADNDDDFFVGFDDVTGTASNLDAANDLSWEWERSAAFNLSAGDHTVNIWGGDGGVRVDRIIVTNDVNFVPLNQGPPQQCQWSYETDCRNYQANTCNGEDFDGIPGGTDDDVMLATGSMNACYAEWEAGGDAFDLSGNVKEWTAERSAGVNPIRGGSFNNTAIGTSCQFDFLTADDSFFLPNIGFRCCR
jgi:hypothetical protein